MEEFRPETGDLFDLLSPAQQDRLRALEARSADPETARERLHEVLWGLLDGDHLDDAALGRLASGSGNAEARARDLAHLAGCRDCGLAASVLLAGDPPREAPSSRSSWRPRVMAVAATLILMAGGVWIGTRLGAPAGTEAPAVDRSVVLTPVFLGATRGAEVSRISRSEWPDGMLQVAVEATVGGGPLRWALQGLQADIPLHEGQVELPEGEPRLRELVFRIDTGPEPVPQGSYRLILRDAAGRPVGMWPFALDP